MTKTNRRKFIRKSAAAASLAATVGTGQAAAQTNATKKVFWKGGKKPDKTPLFSPAVAYGNLLFLSGIGAHFTGDIKSHTKHVLDEIQQKLESSGSSMQKVLKCQVYLANSQDYQAMNEVFQGRFGFEPPVRTTIAAAWIPGNSLVEIDVVAYI